MSTTNANPARQRGLDTPNSRDRIAAEYDCLRTRLRTPWSAPTPDVRSIDDVMKQLDDAHAAYKAQHARAHNGQRS